MKPGVVFPQIEIGVDPGAVRAYGQAVEQIGYHHILAYEHVVGANTASRPNCGAGRTTSIRCSTSRSCCSDSWPG